MSDDVKSCANCDVVFPSGNQCYNCHISKKYSNWKPKTFIVTPHRIKLLDKILRKDENHE